MYHDPRHCLGESATDLAPRLALAGAERNEALASIRKRYVKSSCAFGTRAPVMPYFEEITKTFPSGSFMIADVPHGSLLGGFTNSTPRAESSS